jgi:hypothetical protein
LAVNDGAAVPAPLVVDFAIYAAAQPEVVAR